MTNFRVNLVELSRQVFGIKGFIPVIGGQKPTRIEFDDLPLIQVSEANATSILGTPIREIIKFEGGVIRSSGETFDPVELIDFPLTDITLPKQVITTAIQGRPGKVKEFIALDDYSVRIRGLMVEDNSYDYPREQVADMNALARVPQDIEVESEVMNLLGINNLVILKLDLPRLEGFTNVQPYILECISDDPIELKINAGL